MIIVQGKVLEVGDTAVFRCGGKAVVTDVDNGYLTFNEYDAENYFNNDGTVFKNSTCITDIIDIIKAPKPNIGISTYVFQKDDFTYGTLIIKTNDDIHKILSVEIA